MYFKNVYNIADFQYFLAAIMDFQKSKFHSAYLHLGHLEILHSKWHDQTLIFCRISRRALKDCCGTVSAKGREPLSDYL